MTTTTTPRPGSPMAALHAAIAASRRGEGRLVWCLTDKGRVLPLRVTGALPEGATWWCVEGAEKWQPLQKARG